MKNDTLSTKRPTGTMLLCATAMATFASLGCGNDADEGEQAAVAGAEAPLALQSGSLRDPNGLYYANVTANGSGCPAGSYSTAISSDGQTFTTTFSEYEAQVTKSDPVSVKDCILSVKLHSPAGTSYAVQEFFYSGYAFLEQGVSGRQTASYYFSGDPVPAKENRTELVGPKDESYLFSDKIKTQDQVWSPCGKERELQIVTRVRVENGPRRNGYLNLSAIDARINGKLVLKLGLKKCDASGGNTGSNDDDRGNDEDSGSDERDDDSWNPPRDNPRNPPRDNPRDNPRNPPRDNPRNPPRDGVNRDNSGWPSGPGIIDVDRVQG